VWDAIAAADAESGSALEAYHDACATAWRAARLVAIARRAKAFLDGGAASDAECAAALARRHPQRVRPEVAALLHDAGPLPAIVLGVLLAHGIPGAAAGVILAAAADADPTDPRRTGSGLDAVELDIWSEVLALDYAGQPVTGLDARRAAAAFGPQADARGPDATRIPPGFATIVRRYLEDFRLAALHWARLCKVRPPLCRFAEVLGCAQSTLYNRCCPALREALEEFLTQPLD
jgi:hypothetical protein